MFTLDHQTCRVLFDVSRFPAVCPFPCSPSTCSPSTIFHHGGANKQISSGNESQNLSLFDSQAAPTAATSLLVKNPCKQVTVSHGGDKIKRRGFMTDSFSGSWALFSLLLRSQPLRISNDPPQLKPTFRPTCKFVARKTLQPRRPYLSRLE